MIQWISRFSCQVNPGLLLFGNSKNHGDPVFVITGGGSGIGRALAHALVDRGESVLIIGRHESRLVLAGGINPLTEYIVADVATRNGRELIAAHLQDTPAIKGLVHNAGIIEPIAPAAEIDESSWRQVMATNVEAPLYLTQLLHKKLAKGRVLHMGSGAAHFPVTGWTAYCVSKAALAMLTRCLQLESENIAFASVMPGIIDTNMQATIRHVPHMETEKQNFFRALKENQQLLSCETVALFLSWLLLDITTPEYIAQEWDVYDKTHHHHWLTAPHQVPVWE